MTTPTHSAQTNKSGPPSSAQSPSKKTDTPTSPAAQPPLAKQKASRDLSLDYSSDTVSTSKLRAHIATCLQKNENTEAFHRNLTRAEMKVAIANVPVHTPDKEKYVKNIMLDVINRAQKRTTTVPKTPSTPSIEEPKPTPEKPPEPTIIPPLTLKQPASETFENVDALLTHLQSLDALKIVPDPQPSHPDVPSTQSTEIPSETSELEKLEIKITPPPTPTESTEPKQTQPATEPATESGDPALAGFLLETPELPEVASSEKEIPPKPDEGTTEPEKQSGLPPIPEEPDSTPPAETPPQNEAPTDPSPSNGGSPTKLNPKAAPFEPKPSAPEEAEQLKKEHPTKPEVEKRNYVVKHPKNFLETKIAQYLNENEGTEYSATFTEEQQKDICNFNPPPNTDKNKMLEAAINNVFEATEAEENKRKLENIKNSLAKSMVIEQAIELAIRKDKEDKKTLISPETILIWGITGAYGKTMNGTTVFPEGLMLFVKANTDKLVSELGIATALEAARIAAGIIQKPTQAPAPVPDASTSTPDLDPKPTTPPNQNKGDEKTQETNESKPATPKLATPKPASLLLPTDPANHLSKPIASDPIPVPAPTNPTPANPVPVQTVPTSTTTPQPPVSTPVPSTLPPASAPKAVEEYKAVTDSLAAYIHAKNQPSELHNKNHIPFRSDTHKKVGIAAAVHDVMSNPAFSPAKKLVEVRKYIRANKEATGYRPGFLAGKLSGILHQAETDLLMQLEKQPFEKAVCDLQDYVNRANETKQIDTLTFGFRTDQKKKLAQADIVLKLFAPLNEGNILSSSKEDLETALASAIAANTAATTSTPFVKGRLDEIFKNMQAAMKADPKIEIKVAALKCN